MSRLGKIGTQGTFSEQGSIRSLSIDQEEILYEVPVEVGCCKQVEEEGEDLEDLPYEAEDGEGYISSSCSISMSSDLESSHQITVPVFIEPAPPEIRFPPQADTEPDLETGGDLDGLLLLHGGGGGRNPRIGRQGNSIHA